MRKIEKEMSKSENSKALRIMALIAAVAIPVLYVTAIVLMIVGDPMGRVFLAIAFASSFFLAPSIYLLTKFPKDLADIWVNICRGLKEKR